jgi:2-polyprenyl-6-methoxyphenol hydroxylase-like FAD-dependent oxidoreductase
MPDLQVGICGAGIGGLAAAIAIRLAGAKVAVLEAASDLGEIGAGIQMTPNVSRLLIKWGVDKVIGDGLVEFEVRQYRLGCLLSELRCAGAEYAEERWDKSWVHEDYAECLEVCRSCL